MEAANRGASDVGAKSIGLNIQLPHEQVPNRFVSKELSFNFQYFAIRKLHFLVRAKALVVFPGGFGTMDELFETLNLVQCLRINPLPVVLVGQEFWQRAVNMQFLAESGLIDPEDSRRSGTQRRHRKSGTESSTGMRERAHRSCAKGGKTPCARWAATIRPHGAAAQRQYSSLCPLLRSTDLTEMRC